MQFNCSCSEELRRPLKFKLKLSGDEIPHRSNPPVASVFVSARVCAALMALFILAIKQVKAVSFLAICELCEVM